MGLSVVSVVTPSPEGRRRVLGILRLCSAAPQGVHLIAIPRPREVHGDADEGDVGAQRGGQRGKGRGSFPVGSVMQVRS